jgi:hypothetical protein
MNSIAIFVIVAAAISCANADGCWWTGCNLDSWAAVGCQPHGMDEKAREPCPGGKKYHCCPKAAGGDSPGNGGGSDNSGPVSEITLTQFNNAVTANGYPAPGAAKHQIFVNSAHKGLIATKQEAAMALAQFLHESDGLRAKREYACATTQCPGSYATPGCDARDQYYYGRGYIQLSWCYNYRPASLDLYNDERWCTILIWWLMTNKLLGTLHSGTGKLAFIIKLEFQMGNLELLLGPSMEHWNAGVDITLTVLGLVMKSTRRFEQLSVSKDQVLRAVVTINKGS